MSEARFTKGKWKVEYDGYNLIGVTFRKGFGALIGRKSDKECISNAHLITAAPEMYTLLKAINDLRILPTERKLKELLAKARGEHE